MYLVLTNICKQHSKHHRLPLNFTNGLAPHIILLLLLKDNLYSPHFSSLKLDFLLESNVHLLLTFTLPVKYILLDLLFMNLLLGLHIFSAH